MNFKINEHLAEVIGTVVVFAYLGFVIHNDYAEKTAKASQHQPSCAP